MQVMQNRTGQGTRSSPEESPLRFHQLDHIPRRVLDHGDGSVGREHGLLDDLRAGGAHLFDHGVEALDLQQHVPGSADALGFHQQADPAATPGHLKQA